MSKGQQTGMEGVFRVAAELTQRGYIASPTIRNAKGADLLVTDQGCKKAWSIQVKTNRSTFSFFLLGKHDKEMKAKSHLYVLVNLRPSELEYFIVPANIVAKRMTTGRSKNGSWYQIERADVIEYKNKWKLLK